MKKSFKLLSLVLAVVMLVCIIPISSNAAIIKNVNLNYHFRSSAQVRYSTSFYSYTVSTKWYNYNHYQYSDPFYANKSATYYAVVTVSLKSGNVFSDDTSVTFNDVILTESNDLDINTYRYINDGNELELKVLFRYLTVDVNESYSDDIDKSVRRNSGFYIKGETITLGSINFDETYHFDHWNCTGSAVIDTPEAYNSQLIMGDTSSQVCAYYEKHNIKKSATVPSTKTSNGSIKYVCDCPYEYSLVIPRRPNVKVTNGTASIKLSWSKVNPVTRYDVFQYNTKTKKYAKIGTTTSTSFLIKNRKSGTAYYYLVRAYNGNVGSSFDSKDIVKAVTLCSAPKAKASVSGKNVTLKWSKISGAKYYVVCKYNAKTKSYSGLKKLTGTSVKLSKQPKGTNYYLVRAFNANKAGNAYTTKNLVKAVVKK